MVARAYYSDNISDFIKLNPYQILGKLAQNNEFQLDNTQKDSWIEEIKILKSVLNLYDGKLYFEYSIPRMGKRIDVLCIISSTIYIIEFKVGERQYTSNALDQVMDYALDLKNFHEDSHNRFIAPILVATQAIYHPPLIDPSSIKDKIFNPFTCNKDSLAETINLVHSYCKEEQINPQTWETSGYSPTPTIVEAAISLYRGHSVNEISRSEATAINLRDTSSTIDEIIESSRNNKRKSICFVTGVPGAGKTLVGLNIATKNIDISEEIYSVFLSGNGPLVTILREALARDKVDFSKLKGEKIKKGEALSDVKMLIQNVHNFRDECLIDFKKAPIEHVVLFDEAQRAWNLEQTKNFMSRKKKVQNFNQSEPEFLISCLDRHKDWAVIVCLVGGGQEINTGEAGISEWINALNRSYPDWDLYISSRLTDDEYGAQETIENIKHHTNISYRDELHLSVSMRSFRAESVSLFVKSLLDFDTDYAKQILGSISKNYPILLTRDLNIGKKWLVDQARGSERYGIIVSSQAERLKPHAINVKAPIEPIHWFLDGKTDVRSSYYLEDVATEFHIQGLELDWACVTWDADFRYTPHGWDNRSFVGNKWQKINKKERQIYQKNAYRVLLTRARQGMVIVVPFGDPADPTRKPEFYDPTYEYLKRIGIPTT